jgi:hypothetical protein
MLDMNLLDASIFGPTAVVPGDIISQLADVVFEVRTLARMGEGIHSLATLSASHAVLAVDGKSRHLAATVMSAVLRTRRFRQA